MSTETARRRPALPRPLLALVAGVAVLLAVVALPAFALDNGSGAEESDEGATAPETTTSTTTTTAPPTPEDVFAEWYGALSDEARVAFALFVMSPEERVAFTLYAMDEDERAAFARFIDPPPPPPPPAPRPAPSASAPSGGAPAPAAPAGSVWDRLAQCESSGNWAHSGGRYHGGLQFHPGTWNSYGGQEFATYAYQASREQQIVVAERVLAGQGWGAWPACSRKLGLR